MNVLPPRRARATVSPQTSQWPNQSSALLMRRAAFASVSVSAVLVVVKLAAFAATGSVAIMAALADSAVDLVASFGNLLAIHQSLTPADRQHRFGHGKAEPLAGLAQAAFITGSATFLVFESVQHLVEPHLLQNESIGVAVMLVSILATFGLVSFQRYVVRRTGSPAISADNLHYVGDLLTNFGVIAGILLSTRYHWYVADPLIGLGLAGVIGWSAWHVFRQSYDQLMDRELPEPDRERIKSIALAHSSVRGVHDLRTRAAGTTSFIQLHLEMDPAMTLSDAHEASDEVEESLLKAFPGAEILIHQDPHGIEQPPALALS